MDNDIRKRLYQLLSIEDESERETALEQIANDYTTYGGQIESLTSERDTLQSALTKAESDRDVYKQRLDKIVNSTLVVDKKEDEEIEKRIFKERE